MNRRGPALGLVLALLALFAGGTVSRAFEPRRLLDEIRSTTLEPGRTVELRNVELELGIGVLRVDRGVLIPNRPIEGRTVEFVFIGQARFLCDPPDAIEASQLELFTGQRYLDVPLEEAALVIADPGVVQDLLDRPAPRELRPALVERAEQLHRDWLAQTERRTTGMESAIFRALIGDSAFHGFFALWANSYELGGFVYQLDPEDQEQLTVASFVPLGLNGWDLARVRRELRIQQRKGRWLDVRTQDLGAWDVWLSTSWSPASGKPAPGSVGFETEHYALDVTIARKGLRLEGTARLDLRVEEAGRLAVPLELFRDLQVTKVADGKGRELFFFRSGPEVVVVLEEPTVVGGTLALEVTYGGHAIKWAGRRTFDLESTATWYPHCGTVDRATYDVTLRWPKKYDLIAGGRVVERGRVGNYLESRYELDAPSLAFSFALGDFVVEKRRLGEIDLTVAFSRAAAWKLTPALREQAVSTIESSLRYFESIFGPYPLDWLTVVILPRDYSQSFPGFITLSDSVTRPDLAGSDDRMDWTRTSTIAHEVSHQWWGNLLGWWSYRDQWLSEGMANYASLLYYARNSGDGTASLVDLARGWRQTLEQRTHSGRTVESLGPIVLGARLNSSRGRNGYRAVVYRKGAVVLAMLARTIGEQRFNEMLRAVLDAAPYHVISTEEFLQAMEHMSGADLDAFARQYVYGTGIPRIYYTYDVEPGTSGGWLLNGRANRLGRPGYAYRVVHTDDGRWDLRRSVRDAAAGDDGELTVPFRVIFEDEGSGTSFAEGRVRLNGRQGRFEIEVERRPRELRLDPSGEILAYFHAGREDPRRIALYQARDAEWQGRLEEAEREFRRALALPLESIPADREMPWLIHRGSVERGADARIRLALARLQLEQGRQDEARRELDAVEEALSDDEIIFRMERDALRSRLEVLRGDYEPAYRRLKRTLKQSVPRGGRFTYRAALWKARLGSEPEALTEAYVLLAIAALQTGNHDEYRWAVQEARMRGADVEALTSIAGN